MENCQKIKLLKMYHILEKQTDEKHPLTTSAIIRMLQAENISCDRRTLYKDIQLLNQFGYEIITTRVGKENAYYFAEQSFSIPELRILIDAVHSSKFIPEKKSKDLVKKLALLAGKPEAEELIEYSAVYNTAKHTNEVVLYSINTIEEAIRNNKKVSFFYYDLDENKKKLYRKNKERYVVNPIALMINEDKYYLITYSVKYENIVTYRIDRMDNVEIDVESIDKETISSKSMLSRYSGEIFSMYNGNKKAIRVEFSNNLIGVIYDQYGEGIKIKHIGDNRYQCEIEVEISPTFWGWIFQFVGDMKIVSPQKYVNEYIKRCKQVIEG